MFLNKLIYLSIEGLKTIYRSILPSLISSFTISISLIILSIAYFLYLNLYNYTSDFKNEYKIEVFFNDDLSLSESLDAFNQILLFDGVEEGVFGADMAVALVNDGPVTIVLDSEELGF